VRSDRRRTVGGNLSRSIVVIVVVVIVVVVIVAMIVIMVMVVVLVLVLVLMLVVPLLTTLFVSLLRVNHVLFVTELLVPQRLVTLPLPGTYVSGVIFL